MSELDPTPCNEGVLADLTALASQIDNPIAPYPVFYSSGQCGGALTGASFPQYFFPVNCQNAYADGSAVPTANDNCLRIITDPAFDPLSGGTIDPTLVNVLPGGTDEKGTPKSNIFNNLDNTRLFSWYVPPQFRMVFYSQNPMLVGRGNAGPYLIQDPGTLQVNACLSQLALSDGTSFFQYNGPSNCLLASCACNLGGETIPQGTFCNQSATAPICVEPNAQNQHRAPYFVIIQLEEYPNIIREMCVNNRPVSLGTDLNSLNTVWKPQAAGCDNFVTSLCQISNVTESEFQNTCRCFTQQTELNNIYGSSLDVPVCCFGFDEDDPTDISKSCAFDMSAYKTNNMLQNCCSFAECQQIVEKSNGMRVRASPPGEILCQGNFVNFPTTVTPTVPIPSAFVDEKREIPFYSWIVLAVGVVLLFVFVLSLAFVTRQFRFNIFKKKPLQKNKYNNNKVIQPVQYKITDDTLSLY